MKCASDYQMVGKMMYQSYPTIGRYGRYPWSALMASLSSKMRSQRYKVKRKVMAHVTEANSKRKEPLLELKTETDLKGQVIMKVISV